MKPTTFMSRSRFLAGDQCARRLWWQVHEPREPEPEPRRQIAELARRYVPGGVRIGPDAGAFDARIDATRDAIGSGVPLIYDAAFECAGVRLVVDILERDRDRWSAIDVRSATGVQPEHLTDAALQLHTVRACGLDVRRFELMHLNRDCRFPDLSNLFVRRDVSVEVEALQSEVWRRLSSYRDLLAGVLPTVRPGKHCHLPRDCPYLERCAPPAEPARLFDRGVAISTGLVSDLQMIRHPVAHLDLGTVTMPVPVWPGCRPYEAVPAQISVNLEHDDGTVEHREWLADGPDDPRDELIEALIEFTEGAETVTGYPAPLEIQRIEALQEGSPFLAARLDDLIERTVDLHAIVRGNLDHPGFGGRYDLRSVAPVLIPDVDFRELAIRDGQVASLQRRRLLFDREMGAAERRDVRAGLLERGRLGSWAMVRLHATLRQLAGLGGIDSA